MDSSFKDKVKSTILKKIEDDDEMIRTLEMFLQYNLNVSETAKKMYMHRNSLQYRIDKFIAETGVNVQNFEDAVAVKMAILIKSMHD